LDHAANLARLELTLEEKEKFGKQLSVIVDYFKIINEAKTEGIVPTSHALNLTNVLRDDREESFSSEKIMRIVPHKRGRFVKAPKIA
jgi:aspartyl-tRNA(Asn)/glutamyl-tRNA(Gln) amidotransferase subunit C